MKKHHLLALVIMTMIPLAAASAAKVVVRIHKPPPGQLQYENLWWVELNNTTQQALRVYLHGEVRELTKGLVFRANTNEFDLPPGPKTVRARDITVRDEWHQQGYELFVRRTGTLPDGNYTYTVTVQPGDLGEGSVTVQIGRPEGLRLLSPEDGATSTERFPFFTWAPGAGRRPVGLNYSLVIAPIRQGQSKEQAMASNRPWFAKSGIMTATYRYSPTGRPFAGNSDYAWQVAAHLGGAVVAVSDIWRFHVGATGPDTLPAYAGMDIYFVDGYLPNGRVYRVDVGAGTETPVYTRPSGNLHAFFFAPWNPNLLYFVNANTSKIQRKDLGAATPEQVVYTHSTYVRDIGVGKDGKIYFSEATGAGANGKIYRLADDGTTSLFYTVALSSVDGYWGGEFTFDSDGVLYLSSGNRKPAGIYRVDVAGGTVTRVFAIATEAIEGMAFGEDGLLYYANWGTKLSCLNLATSARVVIYQNPGHHWMSDVGFMPSPGGVKPPAGASTWVMPWGVTGTRLDYIKATGLTDYTDAMSGIAMSDAPFGGYVSLRHGSSPNIPGPGIKYYRWQYRPEGGAWAELTDAVFVYYVKDVPGFPPVFVPYRLGPNPIGGKSLYEFRPPASALPAPPEPGATVYWPGTGFLGDVYSGYWNTEASGLAPGKYEVRLTVYDPMGLLVMPSPATFRFVVPNGQHGDTILTRFSNPAELDAGGYRFSLAVDNRPCSAAIAVPTMGGTAVADECGMLRYDPASTNPVHIAFTASHPDSFGVFSFSIIRGATAVTSAATGPSEVTAASSGIYTGDGTGNFFHDYSLAALFDPPCTPPCYEAAYSENLYVYAKATTGNGYRIGRFDRSFVRAFGLAKQHP